MQSSTLTPGTGTFMKEWNLLDLRLTQIGGLIADAIEDSMVNREALLLNNEILLPAIYVDPKYRVTLSEQEMLRARETLLNVAQRMNLKGQEEVVEDEVSTMQDSTAMNVSSSEDEYEKLLDLREQSYKRQKLESQNKGNPQKFRKNFQTALKEMESFNRTSKKSVQDVIPVYPELIRKAAIAVTGLPPTQVSVERLFSALRIIKSDLRGNLKEDLIETILFLRSNM